MTLPILISFYQIDSSEGSTRTESLARAQSRNYPGDTPACPHRETYLLSILISFYQIDSSEGSTRTESLARAQSRNYPGDTPACPHRETYLLSEGATWNVLFDV